MSNSTKYISSDLRLALRAQQVGSVIDRSDDLDPERLYPGIEEEEEEEDDDEDVDEEDDDLDGDRGDDVDPDIGDDDDDTEPGADDDEPDGGDDLDPEALAELAGESGKGNKVPQARFNQINEALKHERTERLRLEEELARARGSLPVQQPADKELPADGYDFDAAEARYMDALMDGETAAAAAIRKEIRAEERKEYAQQSVSSVQQATEAERQRSAAEAEQSTAQQVLSSAIAKYPFLDHEGADADADAIEEVIARRDLYLKQGMTFSKALSAAVEKVAPRYSQQEEPVKARSKTASAEQINRNLEREKRIPAAMPGVGERGKDIDYANLSEDEFDALSEQDKRKARGDFVKEDA